MPGATRSAPKTRSVAQTKAAPGWQWVHDEMQRADARLLLLWHEWREQCPHGMGYSQFAQIFVAVLGHSNFTYLEAVASH